METTVQSMVNHAKEWIIVGGVIIVGAVAHATQMATYKKSEDEPARIFVVDWFIALPLAIFSGIIFALIAYALTEDLVHHAIAAALGSVLGLRGVNRVSERVLDRLVDAFLKK